MRFSHLNSAGVKHRFDVHCWCVRTASVCECFTIWSLWSTRFILRWEIRLPSVWREASWPNCCKRSSGELLQHIMRTFCSLMNRTRYNYSTARNFSVTTARTSAPLSLSLSPIFCFSQACAPLMLHKRCSKKRSQSIVCCVLVWLVSIMSLLLPAVVG